MKPTEKISYLKKHLKKVTREVCNTAKDVAFMFFNTKDYNDNFLEENGEPTMDEYAEIMRNHDLKTEKAKGYYFGEIKDISKGNER